MKNIKKKVITLFCAMLMLSSFGLTSVYAEPDLGDDNNSQGTIIDDNSQTGGDNSNSGDGNDFDQPDEPPYSGDTPDSGDTPAIPDNLDYPDDSGDNNTNSGDDTNGNDYPDDNQNDGYYDDWSQEPQPDYDNSYNPDTVYDGNTYVQNFDGSQGQVVDYNQGMTFDEFEKATDYDSATVAATEIVDMYNSNGSSSKNTLDADAWQEISLNLSKVSSDNSGDFSFIKDNDADSDSNFSILFMIFGVIFVAGSLGLATYLIISTVRGNKRINAIMLAESNNTVAENTETIPNDIAEIEDIEIVDDDKFYNEDNSNTEETGEIIVDEVVSKIISDAWQESKNNTKRTKFVYPEDNNTENITTSKVSDDTQEIQ